MQSKRHHNEPVEYNHNIDPSVISTYCRYTETEEEPGYIFWGKRVGVDYCILLC
jgi:hypothetical protein